MDGIFAMNWMENATNTAIPFSYSYAALRNINTSIIIKGATTPTVTIISATNVTGNNNNNNNSSQFDNNAAAAAAINSNATIQIINNEFVQATFCLMYIAIFIIGIFGNVLVCYVVFRNKAMHTVTNFFITNLALSDILLCILAVPFTPLYTFLERWIFGKALCHLVAYAQGVSVYISTLTLTAIAVDRFIVIIYPFRHRMKLSTCILIITSIWIVSLLLTLPYGLYVALNKNYEPNPNYYYCEEDWPSENTRKIYGTITVILQFFLPFLMICLCYILVSIRLNDRAKVKLGNKSSKKEEADRDRKKRTNRMLISMVAVFGLSWLPLNSVNIFNDFYETKDDFYTLLFFIAHCIAMSSTCYNPFLYAWLNENFRKEFKQVLPFIRNNGCTSGGGNGSKFRGYRPNQTFCNGNDESLLPGQSTKITEIIPRGPTFNDSLRKGIKVKIQRKNDGFDLNNVQQQQQQHQTAAETTVCAVGISSSETKVLSSGVLETPFDVITLSAADHQQAIKSTNNNVIAENL